MRELDIIREIVIYSNLFINVGMTLARTHVYQGREQYHFVF